MHASARSRFGVSAVATVLALALLAFTTIYRNSRAFSPSGATRCYSLSCEHKNARALFEVDLGPLSRLSNNLPNPILQADTTCPAAVLVVPAARNRALTVTPLHRPPPPLVG
jgi:hypothetical protein